MANISKITISNSKKREDYEILIKHRYDLIFLAYCPQINQLIKGNDFNSVHNDMEKIIAEHINFII